MRKILFVLAVAIIGFLLSPSANAQSSAGADPALSAPIEGPPQAWAFGAHMLSFHKPGTHMHTVTPGAYALHRETGFTLGAYSNSEGRASVYVGKTYEWPAFNGQIQLTVGAVTGYAKVKVLPMAAPSYKWANGYRVSIIPNPFGQSAIHLSREF